MVIMAPTETLLEDVTVSDEGQIAERTGTKLSVGRHSHDRLFEMLSNDRRRCVVYYLQQADGDVALSDLVDYVTAWQYEQPLDNLDSRVRARVYASLHQVHLPRLDRAELLDYDTEQNTVSASPRARDAQFYLEYDPSTDIRWSTMFGGLLAVGVGLAVAGALSMFPFAWLGTAPLVWLVLSMFGLASVGMAIHERRNKRAVAELFEVER